MKKQFKNPIFKSVLLLLSVVLLTVSAVIIATAIDTATVNNPKYLTLNFDPNQISSCTVYHEVGGKMVEHTVATENGQTVVIESGVKVRVVVIPKNGLWPEFTVEGQVAQTEGCVAQWTSFKNDSTLTVTCTNREYIIHALDYDRRDINKETSDGFKIPYVYTVIGEGWSNSLLTSDNVKYRVDDKLELPAVNEEGEDFTFDGWYIITGSGTEGDDVLWIEADETDGKYYIPQSLTMNEYMYKQGGYIYVYPKLVFKSYIINRIDIVHDTDFPQHIQTPIHRETREFTAKEVYSAIKEKFWADDPEGGGYKQYPGYYFVESCPGTSTVLHPQTGQVLDSTDNPNTTNVVYRFYQPIAYTLTYYDDDGTALEFNGPSEYIYSHKTEIGQPSRTGYHFAGWKVQVYKNGQWTDEYLSATEGTYFLGNGAFKYEPTTNTFEDSNAIYASEKNESGEYEIRLIAQWEAIDINVKYEFGEGVDSSLIANASDFLPGGKFTSFKYDTGIIIDNPVRVGWKFMGWTIKYADGSELPTDTGLSDLSNGKYQIAGFIHTKDIVLEAKWERKIYTVVLDGQGADAGFTTQIENVQYGMALVLPDNFVLPQRVGYTFGGYYSNSNCEGNPYIDENGNSKCNSWELDEEEIKLYAHWIVNNYNIIIPTIEKIPAGAEITIVIIKGGIEEKHSYTQGFQLPYGTEFRVEIAMPSGYKIVEWNGQTVNLDPEANEGNRQPVAIFYSANYTVGAAPEGMTLIAKARPAAPNLYTDVLVGATEKDAELKVEFKSHIDPNKYEFAISLENNITDDTLDVWRKITDGQSYYLFKELPSGEALQAGAYYWVFIRLAATQEADSGVILKVRVSTDFDELKASIIKQWSDMLTNKPGSLTDKTITDTLTKIENLAITDDLHEQIELIISAAEAELVISRLKDARIAELNDFYMDCILSGLFSDANKAELLKISAQAESQIRALEPTATAENVNNIFEPAIAAMMAVPVSYLKDGSITLSSLLGLNQGSSITLNSVQDIKALRRAIADAIAQGRITADSFITVEEAQELLRTLDTVSAYNFSIINVQLSEGDVFTLTLTIPEALISRTGLQVAYFNQATGTLELLETTREGNALIFKAKHIANFVILADPNVDLTAAILALGAILLCQLIAIAFVLISRNKAKNSVMHASAALPVLLTVRFLPMVNAELVVLGLGVAVILAQIVLMWLLLSSGMIRVFKTQRTEPTHQEVTAVVREEDLQEDPYAAFNEETDAAVEEVLDEVAEEALDEIAEEFIEEATEELVEEPALDEDAFDEELAQELAYEQNEAYAEDEYAEEVYADEEYAEETYAESDEEIIEEIFPDETEEVYEDEEFIGEAPEAYYSIDEEENVYAYDEEEAEHISDAQETNESVEETAYGTDLFDGIFGESYEPDGNPSNEGGDPRYEEPYGDSYSYADAEDAQTENADREETEGQGTVDPYAYVVEDDGEEVSDDEEMYRYDE